MNTDLTFPAEAGGRLKVFIPFMGEAILEKYGEDRFGLSGRNFMYELNHREMRAQLRYLMSR